MTYFKPIRDIRKSEAIYEEVKVPRWNTYGGTVPDDPRRIAAVKATEERIAMELAMIEDRRRGWAKHYGIPMPKSTRNAGVTCQNCYDGLIVFRYKDVVCLNCGWRGPKPKRNRRGDR